VQVAGIYPEFDPVAGPDPAAKAHQQDHLLT
jgi:hypothetical protein